MTKRDLENHENTHEKLEMSQIDKAQLNYAKVCKDTRKSNLIEANSAKSYISSNDLSEKIEQGYALPSKENVRFTKEQKIYLENLFVQGEQDKTKRARPEAAEKDMILKFGIDLVIEESKITSYFSRLCANRKKQKLKSDENEVEKHIK